MNRNKVTDKKPETKPIDKVEEIKEVIEEVKEESKQEEPIEEPQEEEIGKSFPFTKSILPDLPDISSLDDQEQQWIQKHQASILSLSKLKDDSAFELKTQPSDKNNNLSVWMKAGETKDSAWVIGEATAEISFEKIVSVLKDE